jgi:hypothetical protein
MEKTKMIELLGQLEQENARYFLALLDSCGKSNMSYDDLLTQSSVLLEDDKFYRFWDACGPRMRGESGDSYRHTTEFLKLSLGFAWTKVLLNTIRKSLRDAG